MAKREHGYIALIPVFIPVSRNDLENQIAAGRALLEATQSGSLDQIMALPGLRLHVKPGKDIANRWTSVQVAEADEAAPAEEVETADDPEDGVGALYDTTPDEPITDESVPEPEDAAQTHGRRRSRAA